MSKIWTPEKSLVGVYKMYYYEEMDYEEKKKHPAHHKRNPLRSIFHNKSEQALPVYTAVLGYTVFWDFLFASQIKIHHSPPLQRFSMD